MSGNNNTADPMAMLFGMLMLFAVCGCVLIVLIVYVIVPLVILVMGVGALWGGGVATYNYVQAVSSVFNKDGNYDSSDSNDTNTGDVPAMSSTDWVMMILTGAGFAAFGLFVISCGLVNLQNAAQNQQRMNQAVVNNGKNVSPIAATIIQVELNEKGEYQDRNKLQINDAAGNNFRRYKEYVLRFQANTTYVIEMHRQQNLRDPYLLLLDKDGKILQEDNDSAGNFNSRIEFTPGAEQTLHILATTSQGNDFGDFLLTIRAQKKISPVIEKK